MRPFQLYKHENCTDVAMMFVKYPVFIPEKNGYKFKVRWFNIVNPRNVFDMNEPDTIFIKKEDLPKWKEFHEPV